MKTLFLSLLFVLPFMSAAQMQPQPFKGANTIVIQTNDSSHIAYEKLARAFVDAGLSVANSDPKLGVLNSNPKVVKSSTVNINASMVDKANCKIILSGFFNYGYAGAFNGVNPNFPIQYKGTKGSEYMNTWLQMQMVAASYPGATISYQKR